MCRGRLWRRSCQTTPCHCEPGHRFRVKPETRWTRPAPSTKSRSACLSQQYRNLTPLAALVREKPLPDRSTRMGEHPSLPAPPSTGLKPSPPVLLQPPGSGGGGGGGGAERCLIVAAGPRKSLRLGIGARVASRTRRTRLPSKIGGAICSGCTTRSRSQPSNSSMTRASPQWRRCRRRRPGRHVLRN